MKKKNVILAIVIFLILILIVAGTYSYWRWSSGANKNIVFTTAGIDDYVVYDEGDSHFIGNFQAYATFCESASATISIYKKPIAEDVNLMATVYMNINSIGNNISASSDVNWLITEGDSSITCSGGTSSSIIGSGSFNGKSTGDVITLASDIEVTLEEKKYTIWIWVDSAGGSLSSLVGEVIDTNIWTQIDINTDGSGTGSSSAPSCSLSASGTTITASINHKNLLSYYGWDSSFSGVNSNNTTIGSTGIYTFYVKDITNKTCTCSGEVVNTTETTTSKCEYQEDSGGCYYNSSSYLTPSGSCSCNKNSSGDTPLLGPGTCTASKACACSTGSVYANNCSLRCSVGTLSGQYCKVYTGYTTVTTYSCDTENGYAKLNDSYCWKSS